MRLLSIDPEYSGYVDEIRGYTTAGTDGLQVSVVLRARGAWYSEILPVTVSAELVRHVHG